MGDAILGGGGERNVGGRQAIFRVAGIECHDLHSAVGEFVHEQIAGSLFDHICSRLVGEAEDADGSAGPPLHEIGQPVDLRSIEAVDGAGKVAGDAQLLGQAGERQIIAREARSAVADGAFQVLGANARIEAKRRGDYVDVGAIQLLADAGEHVRVADLGGDVSIYSQLGDFRIHKRHTGVGGLVLANLGVEAGEEVAGALVRFADQEHVGIEEVANDAAQRNEFRAVAEAKVGSHALAAGLFESLADGRTGGARHYGAGQADHVIVGLVSECVADGFTHRRNIFKRKAAAGFAGGGHYDEGDVGGVNRGRDVFGGCQTAATALEKFAESGFVYRRLAGSELFNLGWIVIHADDSDAARGQTGRHGGAQFAQADYTCSNAHLVFVGILTRAALLRALAVVIKLSECRGGPGPAKGGSPSPARRRCDLCGNASGLPQLFFNPDVGDPQAFFQPDRRLPCQHAAEQGIVAVAAAHALRLVEVVLLAQLLACDLGNDVDELIDGYQFVGSEVQGFGVVAGHQPDQAFDAVVNEHEGAGLFTVAPDFDFAAALRESDLSGDGRGSLLLATLIGAERPVHVVKAHDPSFQLVVFFVVAAEFFGEQLLPAIARFGVGRNRVAFLERGHLGIALLVLRINASGGRKEKALHAVDPASLQHVRIDEDVVARDIGVIGGDVADAPHVGGQIVNLIYFAARRQTVFEDSQIGDLEVIGRAVLVFGLLEVGAAYPAAIMLKTLYQMVADKATRPGH